MRKQYNKKLNILLVLILILSSLSIIPSSSANKLSVSEDDEYCDCDCSGYIIKFKEKSLSSFISEIKEKISNNLHSLTEKSEKLYSQSIGEHRNKLLSNHKLAKNEILKLISDNDMKDIFSFDFINTFNGMAIQKVSDSVLGKIKELSFVEDVYQDYTVSITLDKSVPLINADDVWNLRDDLDRNVTGEGVSVAIIDTGVNYNHIALGGGFGPGYQVAGGYDFVTCNHWNLLDGCEEPKSEDGDPMDESGHGTHCAGIVKGVAPNVTLYAYRVLNKDGEGYVSWAMEALERCVDPNDDGDFSDHMDIVSISFGFPGPGDPDYALNIAIDNAVYLGLVVVASAGNLEHGETPYGSMATPGCSRKAITVGSSTNDNHIASSSRRGPTSIGMIKPDVVAPGVGIRSTWLDQEYRSLSGTSMACPHVSGTAALILQMYPSFSPDEIKMRLRNTAVDIGYNVTTQGYGRIDALQAVSVEIAPPIAIINTSGTFDQMIIDLYGTATAEEFQSYSLYYYKSGGWIKVYENDNEVEDDILLRWDTRNILPGRTYQLKLQVDGNDQTSSDIVLVTLGGESNQSIFIESPFNVDENECFTVNITDKEAKPVKGFIVFYPLRFIPIIKYGSSTTFKAPRIANPFIRNRECKIMFVKLLSSEKVNTSIFVKNTKYSIH